MEKYYVLDEGDINLHKGIVYQNIESRVNIVKSNISDILGLFFDSKTLAKSISLSVLLGLSQSVFAGYKLNGFYIWKMNGKTYSIRYNKETELISWKEARKLLIKSNFNVSDILKKKIISGESEWNKNVVGINLKNKKESAKVDACFMQINSQHYEELIEKGILEVMHLWVGQKGSEERVLTRNVNDILKPEVCAKAAKIVLKKHGGNPYTAWYALSK